MSQACVPHGVLQVNNKLHHTQTTMAVLVLVRSSWLWMASKRRNVVTGWKETAAHTPTTATMTMTIILPGAFRDAMQCWLWLSGLGLSLWLAGSGWLGPADWLARWLATVAVSLSDEDFRIV